MRLKSEGLPRVAANGAAPPGAEAVSRRLRFSAEHPVGLFAARTRHALRRELLSRP